jgi:hypothetical protein
VKDSNSPVFIPYPVERVEYVTRDVRITEQRAPTDESVRLLKELEEAARAKIYETFVLADNGFECRVAVDLDALTGDRIAVALFTLNGKKISSTVRIAGHEIRGDDPERNSKLFCLITDEMAKDIAHEILTPAYLAMLRALGS